jgi:hypothetical protein
LRAALDDVAGDDSGGEPIPIVALPPEFEAERCHRQRRVRRSAGDDDVRSLRERLDDGHGAEVRVRREHAIANGREWLPGIHVRQRVSARRQLVEAWKQVVAGHHTNANLVGDAVFQRDLPNRRRASRRIDAARVRHDPDAALGDACQDALDRTNEVARVAHVWVAFLLLLQNRHRYFGEIVEHQIVDVSALDLAARRLEPIAPETLTGGDAHDVGSTDGGRRATVRGRRHTSA